MFCWSLASRSLAHVTSSPQPRTAQDDTGGDACAGSVTTASARPRSATMMRLVIAVTRDGEVVELDVDVRERVEVFRVVVDDEQHVEECSVRRVADREAFEFRRLGRVEREELRHDAR